MTFSKPKALLGALFTGMSLIFSLALSAQKNDSLQLSLPDVTVITAEHRSISTASLNHEGKPAIIIFWKSCCDPNIKMLDALNEVYTDWAAETGVTIYAVSIDDSRSSAGIAPLANGKGWEFVILLDINSEFKRAMHVNVTPHIFILNGNNQVVWQKAAYNPGDENEIYKVLLTLKK